MHGDGRRPGRRRPGRSAAIALVWLATGAAPGATPPASGGPDGLVSSGTGFFVTAAGHLVTSAHVLKGCPRLAIWGSDGVRRAAHLLVTDPGLDIALLRAEGEVAGYAAAPAPDGDAPAPGSKVLALGYGVHVKAPLEFELTEGVYAGNDTLPDGTVVRVIRSTLHPGNSGGPVMNEQGALVGMVIGRFTDEPDHGLVLPTPEIESFLASQGLHLLPSASDGAPPSEVLPSISVLVQCLPTPGRKGRHPPPQPKDGAGG